MSSSTSSKSSAAAWWDAAGRSLHPPVRGKPGPDGAEGRRARVALLMATYSLAAELLEHLVRAGATPGSDGVEIGQIRTLSGGGEVFGVAMQLDKSASVGAGQRVQLLTLPQRAELPLYRVDDHRSRDVSAATVLTMVTVPGAEDGHWLNLEALAAALLPLLGVAPPPAPSP